MQRKKVEGTTENLNILTNKVKYIGFELGKVPEVLQEFEPLNYRLPKVYDEKSYKIYKYIDVSDVEILVTPKDRLAELSERYKFASPVSTYMEQNKENLEKYAYFLRMMNQTNLEDIKKEKSILSKTEKKELIKIWVNAKTESKENILRAVICYAIWNPEEAIKEARRKGIFRYKIFGMGKRENNAQYYLNFLVENLENFKFSRDTKSYLIRKASCGWLKEFPR